MEHNRFKKTYTKIFAILNKPIPKNANDVKRFLGVVTYYGRFIPNISSVIILLRQLLRTNSRFKWTTECEKSFNTIKMELESESVLIDVHSKDTFFGGNRCKVKMGRSGNL